MLKPSILIFDWLLVTMPALYVESESVVSGRDRGDDLVALDSVLRIRGSSRSRSPYCSKGYNTLGPAGLKAPDKLTAPVVGSKPVMARS